jgi:uncharacterized protein (DUF983 family)
VNPSLGTMLRRGLFRRCPRCGTGKLFSGWFRMVERCPRCGMRFSREEGFFIGALFVNFAVTETVMFVWLAVMFFLTVPDPPVATILLGAVLISALVPLAFYPFSKTIWAAIHLVMEPLDEREQADAAAYRFEQGDAGP